MISTRIMTLIPTVLFISIIAGPIMFLISGLLFKLDQACAYFTTAIISSLVIGVVGTKLLLIRSRKYRDLL